MGPHKGQKKSGVPLNVKQSYSYKSAVFMAAIRTEQGVERQTVNCV